MRFTPDSDLVQDFRRPNTVIVMSWVIWNQFLRMVRGGQDS
jgi:hypothetical protein